MRYPDYAAAYRRSIEDPENFWRDEAAGLHWFTPFERAFSETPAPQGSWFGGGTTNLCFNAIDRHVAAGLGDNPAIIWESPETQHSTQLTFGEAQVEICRLSAWLKQQGVTVGDRVMIYLPMIPQAALAMLACARIGAPHVVVFSGYAAPMLQQRIVASAPKVIITASHAKRGGRLLPVKETVDAALAQSPDFSGQVLVFDRDLADCPMMSGRDHFWHDVTPSASTTTDVPCEQLPATAPSFILYTAAGDGRTDGMVHDTGGYGVAINSSMRHIFDARPTDVFWSTSDVGWVVGHSYIVYGPLLVGIPTLIYEGTLMNPHAGIWWDIVAKHRVSLMYSAPTALRLLRTYDESFIRQADLTSLRRFYVVGEKLDADTQRWGSQTLGVPVLDHYWQTESGWPMAAISIGIEEQLPVPGVAGPPCMGWRPEITSHASQMATDLSGQPVTQAGPLSYRAPLPPGSFTSVWTNQIDPERLKTRYFDGGHYLAYDWASLDEDLKLTVHQRSDRVVNVAGHRLSLADIDRALQTHDDVAQAYGVVVYDKLKTEGVACAVVLNAGVTPDPKLTIRLNRVVREQIGAVAVPKSIHFVEQIPITPSGDVDESSLRLILIG